LYLRLSISVQGIAALQPAAIATGAVRELHLGALTGFAPSIFAGCSHGTKAVRLLLMSTDAPRRFIDRYRQSRSMP
jgi:hypothetical protein